MIDDEAQRKLRLMGLGDVIEILRVQNTSGEAVMSLPFDQRFEMIVDDVYERKNNNKAETYRKNAKLRFPHADIPGIYYDSKRCLNKMLITNLATCNYIADHKSIVIKGYTSSGKTYISCAFGREACMHLYRTRYYRVPDLLMDYSEIRDDKRKVKSYLTRLTNYNLLILDEWLTNAMTDDELSFLFELFERRYDCTSTIFCSLYDTSDWVARLGGGTRAESITERFVHNSYCIDTGDMNMRELYSTRNETASSGRKASA